ncbi:FAD binding domain-containing protein [Massarina eburnea CBS 473.64]|uniref:FAD binding domain-containing protein n=1 Tax=Massarina eburnea CBS 473.64 TaxID=1395130 RepID=A0A6A6RT88_9PLEO|nr:FAD binding domain-containing protein [Massarina eburnea CBS 473.64]
MAKSIASFTWERGFREPSEIRPWEAENDDDNSQHGFSLPPPKEVVTSSRHNAMGINILRTWPTLYDGTNIPHGIPSWWKPQREVDVLICGAGPSGLGVAISLARQGVSFRIIDKADTPLIAGRADGVQSRFLETLATWGLAKEVAEEGPLIERTAIYKDGKKLLFGPSHQSDSRYRGLHIITQGHIERIYIRDLTRHKILVERSTIMNEFKVVDNSPHPVQATLRNSRTDTEEHVKAKFLVGSGGAASMVRKQLGIPFDGTSTDIYWSTMDCRFESEYPHAWVFGSVIRSNHGGCVIIPREDGYIRFITPEEILEQANKIFAPYTLQFAVWKISERVARSFSSPDNRVHLVGDAGHVHSKVGLVARNKARFETILPTYSPERRLHAVRIVQVSGRYLRFVCNVDLSAAASMPDELKPISLDQEPTDESPEKDLQFLASFFKGNGPCLLGVDAPYGPSIISPSSLSEKDPGRPSALNVRNGVRAPNPRVSFSTEETGYLYDKLTGAALFHVIYISQFATALGPQGFYRSFGGSSTFNIVVVVECVPFELDELLPNGGMEELKKVASFVFDDRASNENAHTTWGADRNNGGLAVVRPDLWVGLTAGLGDVQTLDEYFASFLFPNSCS